MTIRQSDTVTAAGTTLARSTELFQEAEEAAEEVTPAIHVWLIAGQSNNHYGATLDPDIDIGDAALFQWGRASPNDGVIIAGADPLDHVDKQTAKIGYAVAFMRDYYIPNEAPDQVILVPSAEGSTGFVDNKWNPGDVRYLDAVSRTLAAATASGGTIKGILWHQGETDQQAAVAAATFRASLETMITAMRSALGNANLPFLMGGMTKWSVDQSNGAAIQYVLKNTQHRLSRVGYADSLLPTELATGNVHFTAAEQRTLAGRYWLAYIEGLNNVISWSTSFSTTLPSTAVGLEGYTFRQAIPASLISASGNRVRVSFKAPSGAQFQIDHASIVERDGSTADGVETPTQLFFNAGAAGFTATSDQEVTSDPLAFPIDDTKDYLVIYDVASGDGNIAYNSAVTGAVIYFKAASDSWDQQTAPVGTDFGNNFCDAVSKIEVTQ